MSMLRKVICLASLCAAISSFAMAQATPLSAPHYDVVSIKPNKAGDGSMRWRTAEDSFSATGVNLVILLMNAYDTRADLISGLPAWAKDTHYDVNAKAVDADPAALKNLTREQTRAMLVQILTDRFQLRIHPEVKELPVYDLVTAKEGSRLKPDTAVPEKDPGILPKPGMRPGMIMMNQGDFEGMAIPISSLTYTLSSELERNIIDRTGLTGNFDIHLKWTPDRAASAGPDSGQADAAPPLFTALQEQLGLKLVPARGPVQTWVVDHVEQPTEN